MRRSPIHSVTSAIGRTTRNTARQPRNDSTTPDTVGPTAGATEMTIERLPMTAPRRAGGTSVITVVINSGSMIAVPLACTTRAASSTGNPGASAATSVPALNRPIAVPYRARVGTLRIRKPVIGMITDIVSRKPAVSHWPTFGETPRSVISTGRATAMIVSLRITTNVATSSTPMTVRSRALIAAGAAPASLGCRSVLLLTNRPLRPRVQTQRMSDDRQNARG